MTSLDSGRDFVIRPFRRTDFGQVQQIYLLGLGTGHASYETEAPSWEHFSTAKLPGTVFVAVEADDDEKLLGWVSAAPISTRRVFHGVVEDSIYMHPDAAGRGIGGALLDALIDKCIELGKWSIHSWIFPENEGSAKLHLSRGFEKVGTFSHLAKMTYGELAGQWRDTDIYEKLLPKPEISDATAAGVHPGGGH
ncbi:GNAT family N-acetyltransferase [Corynebacterium sp. 153RC1]|uniref:GNAT family N-acetyltransferase n=1 Tax=Corynebacterium TaxID=1716 RepID=UPI00211C1130|nr:MULTISPECIES: GNAT family N-acetyltransferase [unclassified Corynebacterium]MCQ9371313.1 GNAT family N-acetyltransferase [Corynebacterium sp. 35RC1]MCQ9343297.1 GNAT family N-acetyltransferase [Corynebacterium sp. 76QC2CO]MCQ9351921.1 GNAT family N-acetyltransferase [Corynebacterium sp. 209RC1]MCQ9353670.1 GNAT family N-acetyltransferase [Corynebacterium sp. 1222RC1]MCQ9356346.1 GNAT family N-acetyltransferase [Corynebacterium sp. 122RC1]